MRFGLAIPTIILATLLGAGTFPGRAIAAPREPATFNVTTTADSGPGSLRQAIFDANEHPGADTVAFNIPGPVPIRITPETSLPSAIEFITIDATTQPGFDGTPVVELHGNGQTDRGLTIASGVVRGLVINNFGSTGLVLNTGVQTVTGCYIGTDTTGTVAVPNGLQGIEVSTLGCHIGGAAPGDVNIISGNGGYAQMGGGIVCRSGRDVVIEGNRIGTDVTGAAPLGNSGPGVRLSRTTPVLIGGTSPNTANRIAFNGGPGVYRDGNVQIGVLGNAIYANGSAVSNYNGQYGIHDDFGAGPYTPSLVALTIGPVLHVKGAIYFERKQAYGFGVCRIEFFRNIDCSELGFGQGKEFLGFVEANRGEDRVVTFATDLDVTLSGDETLTCTVTSPDGSTSAFSNCLGDTAGCELAFARNVRDLVSVTSGQPATLVADVSGSAPISYQWYESIGGSSMPIPGATAATYVATASSETRNFKYIASNACGQTSGYANVVPCTGAPEIVTQPADETVVTGSLARLAVSIPFGTVATYQWYRGGSGDTSKPVTDTIGILDALVFREAVESGTFWCRVRNACGVTDSRAASITVVPPMQITSVVVKISGSGKSSLIARGSGIPADVHLQVGNFGFAKAPKATASKITQRGKLGDGRTTDESIPLGATTRVYFLSDSLGLTVAYDVTRP